MSGRPVVLYVSLGLSAALLVAVNLVVRSRTAVRTVLALCSSVLVLSVCATVFFTALLLQAAMLAVLLALLFHRRGKSLYLPASLAATGIAYVVAFWSAFDERERDAQFREEFPVISLEERLPQRRPLSSSAPADPQKLDSLERALGGRSGWRGDALKRVHEQRVEHFVNSPGFGVSRMLSPSRDALQAGARMEVPQPASPAKPGSPSALSIADEPALGQLHTGGVVDFVHPEGFGWIKEPRKQVAGFQS